MAELRHYEREWIPGLGYGYLFYGGPFSNFVGGPFDIVHSPPWLADEKREGLVMLAPGALQYRYHTIEHFFQASKCVQVEQHFAVAAQRDTWKCKAMGQRVELRPDWETAKFGVMVEGLRAKFSEANFAAGLQATDDDYIAEDSPTDFVWGIRSQSPGRWDPAGWEGRNLLGLALEYVRAEQRGKSRESIDVMLLPRAKNDTDAQAILSVPPPAARIG